MVRPAASPGPPTGGWAPGWGDDDHDGDGVFARGLDKHGEPVAVTTRSRQHLVRRRHLAMMWAFSPERVLEVMADPTTPDERDPGAAPRRRLANRRRFYGPAFADQLVGVIVVDYDHGVAWTMFGSQRSP